MLVACHPTMLFKKDRTMPALNTYYQTIQSRHLAGRSSGPHLQVSVAAISVKERLMKSSQVRVGSLMLKLMHVKEGSYKRACSTT
jgi:hypothetical protein